MIKTITSLIVCFIVFTATFSHGAPVITGADITESTVTITGSGFSTHDDFGGASAYLPYAFEDCEAGVIDAASKSWGGYSSIASSLNRTGSGYNLFHERRTDAITYTNAFGVEVSNTGRYGLNTNVQTAASIHNYFISQWIRLSDDFDNITASFTNQVKMLMTTPYDSGDWKNYFQTRGDATPPLRMEIEAKSTTSAGSIQDFMSYGTWHRMDIWYSVPDVTTGDVDEVSFWIDGKLVRSDTQLPGLIETISKAGLISFIGYIDNTSDVSFSIQTDDHFIDFTMARVELSDYATWDETAQHHKELQIPTAWATDSITATTNYGSFQDGDSVYVYVVDADGAVNASGYGPIVLGASTNLTTRPAGYSPNGVIGGYSPNGRVIVGP